MNIKFDNKTVIDFAKYMAHTDDHQQALFFNVMGEELLIGCKGSKHDVEMQFAYMSGDLDYQGCELLEQLGSFAKLRRERK